KESDHATKNFLDWFVAEQVEEEASMDSILQKVRMVGGQPQALLMLDSLLAGRRAEAASQE
ncbi:MAG TPA: ferritin, partial [Kiritimatiellae bacterium]|nr:ferritin [Kiritimatiellia bacterium]